MTEDLRRGLLYANTQLASIRHAVSNTTWSKEISRWRAETFGKSHYLITFKRMLEEIVELKVLLESGNFSYSDAREECADIAIVLTGLCADLGGDLACEITEKHRINTTERKWHSNGDGTGYHIK